MHLEYPHGMSASRFFCHYPDLTPESPAAVGGLSAAPKPETEVTGDQRAKDPRENCAHYWIHTLLDGGIRMLIVASCVLSGPFYNRIGWWLLYRFSSDNSIRPESAAKAKVSTAASFMGQ